jgi:predicted esterase
MKTPDIRAVRGFILLILFSALIAIGHAQETATTGTISLTDNNPNVGSMSDFEVELQAIEMTTPALADSIPRFGTFYSAQHAPGTAEPWPPLPGNIRQLPAWSVGSNFFLLDDRDVDYTQTASMGSVRSISQMSAMDFSPSDFGGGDSGGSFSPMFSSGADYSTNLWLAITNLANNVADLFLSNTIADIQYEIQGKPNLTDTNWTSEGFVLGSELANWTPTSIIATNYPNLFLRARSWIDSDGSGLPDWWQLQYFGHLGVDPYGNPAGDGWNNLQKFQNGMNPNVFYTPPAPQGLTATYNSLNGTAMISWLPSPGPMTGYTLERTDLHNTTTSFYVSSSSYADDVSGFSAEEADSSLTIYLRYQVKAHYAGGDSSWSNPVLLEQDTVSASIVPGPQSSAVLAVSSMPANTVTLRLMRIDELAHVFGDTSYDVNFDISATTNGLYSLTNAMIPPDAYCSYPYSSSYQWYVKAVGTNGDLSAGTPVSNGFGNSEANGQDAWIVPPYFDGRAQLKQNLIFQLRAANADAPFQLNDSTGESMFTVNYPSNYVYVGFYSIDNYNQVYGVQLSLPTLQVSLPFDDNYMYRNYAFDPAKVDSLGALTNLDLNFLEESDYPVFDLPPAYQFQFPPTSGTTVAPLLNANDTRWLCLYPILLLDAADEDTTIGFSTDPLGGGDLWTLNNGVKNYWGLLFASAKVYYFDHEANLTNSVVNAGNSLHGLGAGAAVYMEITQPQFQTGEYDFWNVPLSYYQYLGTNSIPGMTNFSTARTSDLLITTVGNPNFNIAGYAKLSVQNGYSGVYGYLQQYFDKAYKITNGIVTTNTTGVLSPYGQFFATQPGAVALVTMPDVDTGARGTATVYCVSLVLDKNHDGNMDLNFNGADNTSQANPMEFWVNNGHDELGINGNLDFDLEVPPASKNYSHGQITCPRDLENFARLWICGVPSLPLSQNYTFTLSISPSSGNPAINVYSSCETNGGIEYLTDTNIAAQQVANGYGTSLGIVSNNISCSIPSIAFAFGGTQHFLFEGAGIGSGQLTLTISQNGNVIAQSSQWIDLHDIKDLYEQAHATNVTSGLPPSGLISQCQIDHATVAAPDETKQIVVFVHGINNSQFAYYDSTELLFKRLYWSGYHGKVAGFRWPCAYLPPDAVVNPVDYLKAFNYNKGEFYAWKSASAFRVYLNYLRNRSDLTNYTINILGHSQGNIVASEAIRQGGAFDNYILTQAAVPAHCYDTSVPFLQKFLDAENDLPTPFYVTNGGYHGYFTNLTGNLINFYNTNDYALAKGTYFGFQANWEQDQISQKPENFDYLLAQTYYYHPTNGNSVAYYPFSQYTVTDMQEAKAMVARSRTRAIGAQSGVGGVINTGGSVDLVGAFGFGQTREEHSAQFQRNIQTVWGYYDDVLISFRIQHVIR